MKRAARLAIATTLALGWVARSASAQQAPQEGLQEVIVTAEKREQRLQDVPMAISAVSGDTLAALGADGFASYARRLPSLQLVEQSSNNVQLVMRGVVTGADRLDRPQTQPTVGLYLDETQIGVTGANPNMYLADLERLEVLRGPQGTLYGAGAMAGTIRYITRQPDLDKFGIGGGVSAATTHSGDPSYDADAVINAPLAPGVAGLRIVGYERHVGGYIDNVTLNRKNTDDLDYQRGGRMHFLWKPTDSLSLLATAAVQNARLDDLQLQVEESGPLRNDFPMLQSSDDRTRVYSLKGTYDVSAGSLTAVSSYFQETQDSHWDIGGFSAFIGVPPGTFPAWDLDTLNDVDAWTHEVRFVSNAGGRLRWIVGAYWSEQSRFMRQIIDVPGIDAAEVIPPGTDFGTVANRVYDSLIDIDQRQFALFGEGTVTLAERFEMTLGLRYYDVEQNALLDFSRGIFNQPLDDRGNVRHFRIKADGVNPKVNFSFRTPGDTLIYMQAAKGFRLGGPAEFVPDLCQPDLEAIGLTQAPESFKPDKLWSYELGTKFAAPGARLSGTVAAFHIDWKDIQQLRDLPCAFNVYQNAGKIGITGLEVEGSIKLADSVSLTAGLTYTDSELKSDPSGVFGPAGSRTPYVPKFSGSLSLDYFGVPIGTVSPLAGVDVQQVSSRQNLFDAADENFRRMDSYTVVNARFGFSRDDWTAQLFIDNAFDSRGELDRKQIYFATSSPHTEVATLRPRTVGIRFRKKL